MKIRILSFIILMFLGCSSDGIKGEKFGEEVNFSLEKTSLKNILADVEANKGKEFLISGTLTDVCQKKGCWMTVKDELDDTDIFVRFKDYGFFMPKDGFGRKVIAQGIYSNSIDEETNELAHLFTASGVILE
jgi:hypothetical protein